MVTVEETIIELFGEEHETPSIPFVYLNMLSVIAQKFFDNTVVIDNMENFTLILTLTLSR